MNFKNYYKKSTLKYIILGNDGVGLSLDQDAVLLKKTLDDIGAIQGNFITSDLVFFVTWNELSKFILKLFRIFFPFKIWVASLSNNPSGREKELLLASKKVQKWIIANEDQREILLNNGVSQKNVYKIPYPVALEHFQFKTKIDAFNLLKLDYQKFKERIIIGNFQRDTEGLDLKKPKWQKNPKLFLDCIMNMKDINPLILIGGPRRHWIYSQLKKHNIDFIFYGEESFLIEMKDDLIHNRLTSEIINALYNCCDFTLITSKSEGGPKAIPESLLSNTPIWSTDVGFAREFLTDFFIFTDENELKKNILEYIKNPHQYSEIIESQASNVRKKFSSEYRKEILLKLINDIYEK
jgi:glycosyltransferase involved in cell wall biosynthesis